MGCCLELRTSSKHTLEDRLGALQNSVELTGFTKWSTSLPLYYLIRNTKQCLISSLDRLHCHEAGPPYWEQARACKLQPIAAQLVPSQCSVTGPSDSPRYYQYTHLNYMWIKWRWRCSILNILRNMAGGKRPSATPPPSPNCFTSLCMCLS